MALAAKVNRHELELLYDVSLRRLVATAELGPDGLVETTTLTMPRVAGLGALSVSATFPTRGSSDLAGVEAGQSSVVEVVRLPTVVVAVAELLAVLGSEVDAELTVAVLEIVPL